MICLCPNLIKSLDRLICVSRLHVNILKYSRTFQQIIFQSTKCIYIYNKSVLDKNKNFRKFKSFQIRYFGPGNFEKKNLFHFINSFDYGDLNPKK